MYAMRCPSGLHAGSVSNPALRVSRRIVPPSAGIRQIAPWYENATASPSGETRGVITPTARNGASAATPSLRIAPERDSMTAETTIPIAPDPSNTLRMAELLSDS
jgi:hypothetical protein